MEAHLHLQSSYPSWNLQKLKTTSPTSRITCTLLVSPRGLLPGKFRLISAVHLIPNAQDAAHVFTVAGNRAVVWDYLENRLVKQLPDAPLEPRTFPSSATNVLLPLEGPEYDATVLMCGGSSGDIPNPQTLNDCYTIKPGNENPVWEADDNLPNGGQTMTDGILLPDGTVLLINGAHTGSAGGFMADDPVFAPLIYNPKAAKGSRFTQMPTTQIPRLYHSVASLLPSGEVIVAGSNPMVFYTPDGGVPPGWPKFFNNGHEAFLNQPQKQGSKFPTEYRVEIFSPPYMDAKERPRIQQAPDTLAYGAQFTVSHTMAGNNIEVMLYAPGFHTHGQAMAQRMVKLQTTGAGQITVIGPPSKSVMQPGVYLMFVVVDGIPSEGKWVKLA